MTPSLAVSQNGNIFRTYTNNHLLSQAEKDANDFQWYKDYSDTLDRTSFYDDKMFGLGGGEISAFRGKKVNYDLYNNILDKKDLRYVYKPYGDKVGELPANLTNRDISSPKIKALIGIEMSMPFSWKVAATNPQATSRKEQEEAKQIREFVIQTIMLPIQKEEAMKAQQSTQGRQLTPEEQQQIQQQVAAAVQARTPDEVRKYMVRDHKDTAEIMGTQILQYLMQNQQVRDKFNKGFKHAMLAGKEVYRIGVLNGNPDMTVVNALFFDHDQSQELDGIEDGAWAVAEYRMTPSQVLSNFGSALKDKDIQKVFDYEKDRTTMLDTDWTFSDNGFSNELLIRVLHTTWKAPMKIGFLTYVDQNGELQEKMVDENYRIRKKLGDLAIDWKWVPEAHETYKILDDIYVHTRPVPGQARDIDTIWNCKLPYYGASYDNLNSQITSPMDRLKSYQYYYDIILYRIELLMASDKGKILAMNMNAIPKSQKIDTEKFIYFMEANHLALLNPKEEGNKNSPSAQTGEITNLVKEIDMSLVTQINNYIQLAEYVDSRAGISIGVNKQMEGAIGPTEAVTNTKQNLIQASYITRPYYEQHNQVKRNCLQGLIETAKVAWQDSPKKLQYFLDDMSLFMMTVNPELLEESTYDVFVNNASKSEEVKQGIINLAHAALQNDQATLLDVANIMECESVAEAKELMEVAQQKAQERTDAIQKQQMEMKKEQDALVDKRERDKWQHEKEMVILKAEEDRKTQIQKQTILSLGFAQDKDMDQDQIPDVLEVAKFGVDADIKAKNAETASRSQDLEEQKFSHQQEVDATKERQADKKLKIDEKKANKPAAKA